MEGPGEVLLMDCPADDIAFYDDDVIARPWPHYARLRDKGAVVFLSALGNYAITRHHALRAALRDHGTFISGEGAAADDFGCAFQRGNTVASDPPRHTTLRRAVVEPLKIDGVARLRGQIQDKADAIVEAALARRRVDAMADIAQPLPLAIVRDLVGLPDFGRDNMLKWAGAAFDMQGVQNGRGRAACEAIAQMQSFVRTQATPDRLKPGSWTRRIVELARTGELPEDLVPFAIRDYINPSLDTTISAIGHLVLCLARDPESWRALRDDPSLIANAAHEAVRIGTPIRSFARHASRDVEVDGVTIPKGARVMMLFASANRDERVFPEPERFDVRRRNARRHLGFGAGIHMCAGMHLALLEIECVLTALVARVERIEAGEPTVAMNNSICAFSRLPVRLYA